MRFSLLVLMALLLAGCLPQPHLAVQKPPAQLVVRGAATLKVVPDQVEMALAAVTTAASVEEALAANNETILLFQKLLTDEGITRADYRTGQFSIQPQWSRPPRPAPSSWTPEIVGYRVSNSLQVTTARIKLAGRLLMLAQQAGVNKTTNLRFSLADPEEVSRQAIAAATQRARQRAATLVEAAGVKLGRLLEARVEEGAAEFQPRLMMAEAAPRTAGNEVPISAGEVEVQAAVVLSYEIVD